MRCAIVVLAGLLGAACAGDQADRATGDAGAATAGAFRLTEDLRIDGYEADLVPIGGLAVDEDGVIAVLQSQDNLVRFFDAAGAPLGEVGGRGSGPGEFTGMASLGWFADTLWVFDVSQRRFTLISPERQFVRNVITPTQARPDPDRNPELPEYRMAMPQHLYADGTTFAVVLIPVQAAAGEADADLATFVRLASDGVIESVVLRYPRTEPGVTIRSANGGSASASMPFASRPWQHISPDGSRISLVHPFVEGPQAETFTVTSVSARGDTLFSRRYPFDGEPIPEIVADSVIEARARSLDERIPELAEAFRKEARVPPFYPPVEGIISGRDGSIWVRMRRSAEGRPYLVLDAQGEPLGSVTLPATSDISVADLTSLWVLESDENDVESIVRYRVAAPR